MVVRMLTGRGGFAAALSAAVLMLGTGAANAYDYTASNGSLEATVSFMDAGNGNLDVTLTNSSTADVLAPADVLTGFFFDMDQNNLAPVSATLPNGSTVYFGSDGGGNVGGEWAFEDGLSGAPGGAQKGISSTGLNLFGQPNFNGPNLAGPTGVDGLNYGIVSAGDVMTTGNAKVTGGVPLIKNSVTFRLSGFQGTLTEDSVSNISFQYGTSLSEPTIACCDSGGGDTPIPEPMSLALFGSGLIVSVAIRRRRSQPK